MATVDVAGIVVSALTKAKTSVSVSVSVSNLALGVSEVQTVDSSDGSFSFKGLPVGSYALIVTPASGFYSYSRFGENQLYNLKSKA